MNKRSRKLLNYIVAIVFSICCVCLVSIFAVTSSGDILSTPTPALKIQQLDISTIIAQTSSAAQTQTLIAAPFTSTPFIFDTPTILLPVTLASTWTSIPTQTPFVLATQPVNQNQNAVCSCAGDTLNCGNFSTQKSAQACMDYCIAQSAGDIHNLDGGGVKGLACESLP